LRRRPGLQNYENGYPQVRPLKSHHMNYQNRLFTGLTLAVLMMTQVVDRACAAGASEVAGIAFDRQGNLFVANHGTGEILKFAPDGTKSVFASEIKSPYGLAFDSNGNLFVGRPGEILKFAPDGSRSSFTTQVGAPANLTFDGHGNLFVPDIRVSCILRFTPFGQRSIVTTDLTNPAGPVFDRSGNVFAADDSGVYKIGANTMKSGFAAGMSGLALVFDGDENLLVSDKDSSSILKFTPSGVKSIYASGVVPICFAFDATGNLFVSDRNSGSILKFTSNGTKSVFVSGGNRDENAGAAPVSDREAFQKALEYTRAIVEKQHMICLVDVEPLNGGGKTSFRYDHYPEVERIQMKGGGTFARKKDQQWLKSDDWAETGTKVNAKKSDELDSLVQFPFVALDDKISTHDQTQGAVVVRLVKREDVEDTERLYYEEGREKQTGFNYPEFVFSRLKSEPDEKAILEGWAGLMRLGSERIHVNMNYSFLFRVNIQDTTAVPTANPAPSAGAKQDSKQADNADCDVAEEPRPTPTRAMQLPVPEEGKVYGFQDLILHGKDLAGKVVQVEVLPKAEHKTDLHDGRYCITLYDPKRVFGFVYCTEEGLQKLGFEDGTATKNQLIYLLMKKDKLTGTVFYTAVGTRFEVGSDGNTSYSW
jgi:sugar lactone lactonase YvrE